MTDRKPLKVFATTFIIYRVIQDIIWFFRGSTGFEFLKTWEEYAIKGVVVLVYAVFYMVILVAVWRKEAKE